jgi:hypothetical protein
LKKVSHVAAPAASLAVSSIAQPVRVAAQSQPVPKKAAPGHPGGPPSVSSPTLARVPTTSVRPTPPPTRPSRPTTRT